MPLNEIAKNKCFRDLVCAYTGRPVTVRVIAAGRDMPRYFSPDAFDPADVQASSVKLMELAGTRNGIMGAATNGNELVCPYTGAKMSIVALPDGGYRLRGGFSPASPMTDPVAFARAMRTRGGIPPEGTPQSAPSVSFQGTKPAIREYDSSKSPDYALEYAEKVLKPIIPKRATVQVSRKIGKKGK